MVSHRFDALDSLRGIAALSVVFYHFFGEKQLVGAYLCVDFFFVLSGFVITWSYREKLMSGFSISRFVWLRLGRLWPIHFAVLICFAAMVFGGSLAGFSSSHGASNYSVSGLLKAVLFLQVFSGGDVAAWNGPSWSISAEFWTYLIFAIVWSKAGVSVERALIWTAILCSPIVLLFTSDRYLNVQFIEGGLIRCLFGFSLGVLANSLVRSFLPMAAQMRVWQVSLLELLAIACCGVFIAACRMEPISLAFPLAALATVVVVSAQRGIVSRLLLTKLFLWLGALSYSIYMVHMFVGARLMNVLSVLKKYIDLDVRPTPDGFGVQGDWSVALTVLAVVVVVLVSHLTYITIERPAREWSRRQFQPEDSLVRSALNT